MKQPASLIRCSTWQPRIRPSRKGVFRINKWQERLKYVSPESTKASSQNVAEAQISCQ